MLVLAGMCLSMVFCVFRTRVLSVSRKRSLINMNVAGILLMLADRFAYIYRGQAGTLAFWMVRICNFLDFGLILIILLDLSSYMKSALQEEGGLKDVPLLFIIARCLCDLGFLLLVISQFTGLYYTIDGNNTYHRSPAFFISYIIPLTVLILNLLMVFPYRNSFRPSSRIALFLFSILPLAAGVIQGFTYGLSLLNLSVVLLIPLLFLMSLKDLNDSVAQAEEREISLLKEDRQQMEQLFVHTAEALAASVDAKDSYTHGHSARVAKYARMIGRDVGMDERECDQLYYAGLLHDVGKIGIPITILNKPGKLTTEEFNTIKSHPVIGRQILSNIREAPFLIIGASYHHERYDGKGYPEGLTGEDIPALARIIAVADAYDAMTSRRSYRNPLPQQKVKEEIMKGSGTQFDPVFARSMIHLIDLDTDYELHESDSPLNLGRRDALVCAGYRSIVSHGVRIDPVMAHVSFTWSAYEVPEGEKPSLAFVIFDSLDQLVYEDENNRKEQLYSEYAEIRFGGDAVCKEARRMQHRILDADSTPRYDTPAHADALIKIDLYRNSDHLLIRIFDGKQAEEIVIALPDSSRFAYLGITGSWCIMKELKIERENAITDPASIPRIAEEISYIAGAPVGDIPNLQVNNYRTAASDGLPVGDGVEISFHTKSLPTARLVWHCPCLLLFWSRDARVYGEDYKECTMMRFDGEDWIADGSLAVNSMETEHTAAFTGWKDWKEKNKAGYDSRVIIRKTGDGVYTVETQNNGIVIFNTLELQTALPDLYFSLTGDQVALTDIRIRRL